MRAILLGSGLNKFSEHFENIKSLSFEDVLDVTYENLEGHERKFIWCKWNEQTFLITSGKLHFYEGHCFEELIAPLKYAVEEIGVTEFVITSASGGLGENVENGRWTYLDRVLSIPAVNLGNKTYLGQGVKEGFNRPEFDCFNRLPKVGYGYHQGPSLGTNAEYRMLHYLGIDLVGMSMYPEYCYLKSIGVKSYFLSLPVCNYYPFEHTEEPSFEEVLENSSFGIPKLVDIFKQYLSSNKK